MVVIGFIVVGTIGYVVSMYNGLIALKNNVGRAWANIDVLLKQRHDELPKLISTCEGYMQHERGVFDKLSEARGALANARGVAQRADAENQLTRARPGVRRRRGVSAAQGGRELPHAASRISELENQIADRREFYNDSVTIFSIRIQQVPTPWCELARLPSAELFRASEQDREDVKVEFKMAG
jgi:LemA protein